MSDIPPKSPGDYLDPQDTEEPPIRRRGTGADKSAKRKRDAYMRNTLLFTDITDSALIPLVHSGGQARPWYTLRDWTPQYSSSESEYEAVKIEEETPETPGPDAASSSSARPPLPPTPTLSPTPKTKKSLPSPPPKAAAKEVPEPKVPKKASLPSPPPKAVAREALQPKVPKARAPPAGFQRLRPQGQQLTAPVQERLAPPPPPKAKARSTSATSASSSSAYPSSAPHPESAEAAP